jgi:hypothetical protein
MGQAASERVREFTWDNYGDNLIAALQKIM